MARVVKPGGQVLVLEFGQPGGLWGALYRLYSRVVMPTVGGLLTGNRAAYQYLPRTAAAFPAGERFLALMDRCGRVPGAFGAGVHRRHHLAVPGHRRGLTPRSRGNGGRRAVSSVRAAADPPSGARTG